MNSRKYPVTNYIPKKIMTDKNTFNDLDTTLNQMTFNIILNDVDYHFENCYVTNFDFINHECRGDRLNFSKKHYETISKENLNKNILSEKLRQEFISSAIKSEREDLHIEKKVFDEHFNRDKIEKNLEKRGIFFSSMKKRFAIKKKNTDDCKSLNF